MIGNVLKLKLMNNNLEIDRKNFCSIAATGGVCCSGDGACQAVVKITPIATNNGSCFQEGNAPPPSGFVGKPSIAELSKTP